MNVWPALGDPGVVGVGDSFLLISFGLVLETNGFGCSVCGLFGPLETDSEPGLGGVVFELDENLELKLLIHEGRLPVVGGLGSFTCLGDV